MHMFHGTRRTALFGAVAALLAPAAQAQQLAPIPTTPARPVVAPADPDHFTFVAGGDNRATGHGDSMPPSLRRICEEINLVGPDLVLWSGDAIEGYDDSPAEAEAEYAAFLTEASRTGVPFYCAPGNHEFGKDPTLVPVFEKRMGRLYGSFDYGNSHFIALNTDPLSRKGKKVLEGVLDDAQWTWLEKDLRASQAKTNRFVFMHHYVYGPKDADTGNDTGFATIEERDRLHALMVKYKVRAVICGHFHAYWHGVRDGIDYFVSGGAGAPLDASPENGGYLHYIVMRVSGATVTPTVLLPWELNIEESAAGTAPLSGHTLISNSNFIAAGLDRIIVPIVAPGGSAPVTPASLTASAAYSYKGKTKPIGAARVVSVAPDPANPARLLVTVSVVVPAHRTTRVDVSSANAPKG